MDRQKSETSENLLSKIDKMEDISEGVLKASLERLNTPLKKVDYGENGFIDVESGRWKMHAEYVTSDAKDKFDDRRWSQGGDDQKKIEKLIFTISGKEIDIFKSLPEGVEIYLVVPPDESIHGQVREGKKVIVWGDLARPNALIALLHEIGHVIDIDQLIQEGMIDKFVSLDEHEFSEEAAVLRRERIASAFALKIIRPILDKDQLKDVLVFLKNYALKSYYTNAKRAMEAKQATKDAMAHYARHMYGDDAEGPDYADYDEFENWKESDEYKLWKLRDDIKDLEDWEEFAAWRRAYKK